MKKPVLESCCRINLSAGEESKLLDMVQAMGNPLRFEILKFLYTHPVCITGELVDILPIAQSTTSQHLKVLKDSGWICGTVDGTATNYCLDTGQVEWFRNTVAALFPQRPGSESPEGQG